MIMNTDKIKNILTNIKAEYSKSEGQNYDAISGAIDSLSINELKELNDKLKKNKSSLCGYLKSAAIQKYQYIKFRFETLKIELDIFELEKNDTCLISLYENPNFNEINKEGLSELLFIRGYQLKDVDIEYFENNRPTLLKLKLYEYLRSINKNFNTFTTLYGVLKVIDTSKYRDYNTYYNFSENHAKQVAHTAINNYSKFWNYIDLAFQKFDFYEEISKVDSKGKFKKRLEEFESKNVIYEPKVYGIPVRNFITTFYPEIFEDKS